MGGWKDACDAQPITSDRWQELAAFWVAEAVLMAANGYQTRTKLAVLQAGAYIRAWRKSLPEQGQRVHDYGFWRDDQDLLWWALRRVTEAREPVYSFRVKADHLQRAEALLRTWWKRQVAS